MQPFDLNDTETLLNELGKFPISVRGTKSDGLIRHNTPIPIITALQEFEKIQSYLREACFEIRRLQRELEKKATDE